jgi:hypothetical protein
VEMIRHDDKFIHPDTIEHRYRLLPLRFHNMTLPRRIHLGAADRSEEWCAVFRTQADEIRDS